MEPLLFLSNEIEVVAADAILKLTELLIVLKLRLDDFLFWVKVTEFVLMLSYGVSSLIASVRLSLIMFGNPPPLLFAAPIPGLLSSWLKSIELNLYFLLK